MAILLLGGVVTYTRERAPEAPYELVGRVFDMEGTPLALVRVTATRTGPAHDPDEPGPSTWRTGAERARKRLAAMDAPVAADPVPDAEGRSGAEGAFSIRVKEPGTYTLRALPVAPKVGARWSGPVLEGKPPAPIWLHVADGAPLDGTGRRRGGQARRRRRRSAVRGSGGRATPGRRSPA